MDEPYIIKDHIIYLHNSDDIMPHPLYPQIWQASYGICWVSRKLILWNRWVVTAQRVCWIFLEIISLWPSDAIWWHRPWSTMAQVMAWCLMPPSHYLNQCLFIINDILWHSPKTNFTESTQDINQQNEVENYICKSYAYISRGNKLSTVWPTKLAHGLVLLCCDVLGALFLLD